MDLGAIWEGWSEDENALWQDAISNIAEEYGENVANTIAEDGWVQFLYHEALWDFAETGETRAGVFEAFMEYMADTYDIDWEDIYDWEDYRAAYDAA